MKTANFRSAPDQRRGFSLVELLVVIAIVSFLAALLFPVVLEAKRSAYLDACQSNLHQLGIGFHLYANDFDDRYPVALDFYARNNRELLTDFDDPPEVESDLKNVLGTYLSRQEALWVCPADREPFNPSPDPSSSKNYPSAYSYAGSSYLMILPARFLGKPLSAASSSELRILQDAGFWHCRYSDPTIFRKTQNVLFGDGHVKFVGTLDRS